MYRGEGRVKSYERDGGGVSLASWDKYFIRVRENLLQFPGIFNDNKHSYPFCRLKLLIILEATYQNSKKGYHTLPLNSYKHSWDL